MGWDQMTPLERMARYNRGETVDRLPCVPVVGNTAARVIGVKISDLRANGKLVAEAHIEAYRLFRYDVVRVFTDLYVQAEAMGAVIHYPEDETPYLERPVINHVSEISRLQPADPYKDGDLPHQVEAMKRVVDQLGKEVSVTGAVICPLTTASLLVGAENLMRLLRKAPEAVHSLLEVSLETSLRYAKAIEEVGCTPSLSDAVSSGSMISPAQFKEFSYPYLKKLADFIHSRGKPVTLHICGKTHKIWELMADAGADCISIDNVADLEEAKRAVGDRVRLMGNVKPSETMLQGNPEEVRQAVRECVAKAYDSPKGYIVASGCSLPTDTPFENITAMLDEVREIGYPVDLSALERRG